MGYADQRFEYLESILEGKIQKYESIKPGLVIHKIFFFYRELRKYKRTLKYIRCFHLKLKSKKDMKKVAS
jgi:hypothetical protein